MYASTSRRRISATSTGISLAAQYEASWRAAPRYFSIVSGERFVARRCRPKLTIRRSKSPSWTVVVLTGPSSPLVGSEAQIIQ